MSQEEMTTTSKFDGGLAQWIGWNILGFFVTVLTVGICYPWAMCMVYGWKINHTIVEGKRLHFEGKAIGLFGLWIKWILLTIITVGIYSFWIPISLEKWKVKNTRFVGEKAEISCDNNESSTALENIPASNNLFALKIGLILVVVGALKPVIGFITQLKWYFVESFYNYYGFAGKLLCVVDILLQFIIIGALIAAIMSLVDIFNNKVTASKINLTFILTIVIIIVNRIIIPIFLGVLWDVPFTSFIFQFNFYIFTLFVMLAGGIVSKVFLKKVLSEKAEPEVAAEQ